jgi:hypothetical protein
MPQEIIDLDVVAGPAKKVKLGGQTYTLPPDIPVELYLRLNEQSKAGQLDEHGQIKELYDELVELFQYGDSKITKLPIGITTLILAIPTIYGPDNPVPKAEPEGGRRPPRKSAAGTRSSPARRKPATKSHSSR